MNRLRHALAALGRAIARPMQAGSGNYLKANEPRQARTTGSIITFALGIAVAATIYTTFIAPPLAQPLRVTYAGTWTLVELQNQMAAGNVVTLTLNNGDPTADIVPSPLPTGAPLSEIEASDQYELVAQTKNGQWMIVHLSVSAPEALASLRSAGYGGLFSKEALQVAPRIVPLSNGPNILDIAYMVVMIGLFVWIFRKIGGAMGMGSKFGLKNEQKIVAPGEKVVTFADVAGCEEAKLELAETVEVLKNPQQFVMLGAHSPRGVLLYGPPGTGKTLLAKATATEAGVAFFSASGSSFVELFAGQGARHVRDIFNQARAAGRAVIFIDEFDAIGKKRSVGLTMNDEREQTLNELLAQMDGFDTTDDIVVIAATNRLDVIDEALLRPGRFTRKVHVGMPDVEGRRAIIEVHRQGKPIADDVDLGDLAERTAGFSGAMLADLLNEAAILAARRGSNMIGVEDIRGGWLKTAVGGGRQRSMPPRERSIIAAHEAGHALCGLLHDDRRRLMEISLYQHGEALGITVSAADDNNLPLETELRSSLITLMGGRVAEEMLFSDLTGGASKDFEVATDLATRMVTRWGLGADPAERAPGVSGRGQLSVVVAEEGPAISLEMKAAQGRAIIAILDAAYAAARTTLTEHRDDLIRASAYLFEKERIDGKTFAAVVAHELEPSPEALVAWQNASSRYRSEDEVERWLQMQTPALGIVGTDAPTDAR